MNILTIIENRLRDVVPDSELRATARWIAEELTGLSRTEILCGKGTINLRDMEMVAERIEQHEPLQYIFSHTLWRGMDLRVQKGVLIPRPETAELVNWILEENDCHSLSLLDAGTGSGCIAIALKRERPNWDITALDYSTDALAIARENAIRQQTEIQLLQGNMLTLPENLQVDIIVSNPPYIAEKERMDMEENVLKYEPSEALFVPDDDVLRFYRGLAKQKRAQKLYFEINQAYGKEVTEMLQAEGYTAVELRKDTEGNERMVRAIL